jgi:hypothetical protein
LKKTQAILETFDRNQAILGLDVQKTQTGAFGLGLKCGPMSAETLPVLMEDWTDDYV